MPDGHSGYGFPIGGVAAFRAERRGHLAGRHRLRHQLRHASDPDEPHGGRGSPQAAGAGRCALRVGAHRASAAKGFVHLSEDEFAEVMLEGAAGVCAEATVGPRTSAAIEGGGCLPGRRSRAGQRARGRPRARSAGDARLRQPLPRDPGRSRGRRARSRRRSRLRHRGPGAGAGDAALRVPRVRPPDRHRLPARSSTRRWAPTASRFATASWRARRFALPRARRTSAP